MSDQKEQIRSAYVLHEYIQASGVQLKKSGRIWTGCCPFHDDSTPSFVVYEDGWTCFGACATSDDLFGFAMQKYGLTFPEALQRLADDKGIVLTQNAPRPNAQYEQKLLEIVKLVADTYHKYLLSGNTDAGKALAYLMESRALTMTTIETFRLGYAPQGGKRIAEYLTKKGYTESEMLDAGIIGESGYDIFQERIIFPIHDKKGRAVGFGGRTTANDTRKYINSPSSMVFNKSVHLFGIDLAQSTIRKSKTATVVEGYMDAVQAHQGGYGNVVAQMGTAITEPQLKLLQSSANTIVFALDNDSAGQSATQRGIELATRVLKNDYTNRLDVTLKVATLDGKDPDEFIRANPLEFGKRIADAKTVTQYLLETNRAQLGMGADEPTRVAKAMELFPLLTATENDVAKNVNIQMLESAMGLQGGTLAKTAKNAQNSSKVSKQDKTPAMSHFQKIERQILATISDPVNGLGMFFQLSKELMLMAGLEAIDAIPPDCDSDRYGLLGYGFYALSESDFVDSQHRAIWQHFAPQLEWNYLQGYEDILLEIQNTKTLTFAQLLVAVINIRKRQTQLALDAGQAGMWLEARTLLTGVGNG